LFLIKITFLLLHKTYLVYYGLFSVKVKRFNIIINS